MTDIRNSLKGHQLLLKGHQLLITGHQLTRVYHFSDNVWWLAEGLQQPIKLPHWTRWGFTEYQMLPKIIFISVIFVIVIFINIIFAIVIFISIIFVIVLMITMDTGSLWLLELHSKHRWLAWGTRQRPTGFNWSPSLYGDDNFGRDETRGQWILI